MLALITCNLMLTCLHLIVKSNNPKYNYLNIKMFGFFVVVVKGQNQRTKTTKKDYLCKKYYRTEDSHPDACKSLPPHIQRYRPEIYWLEIWLCISVNVLWFVRIIWNLFYFSISTLCTTLNSQKSCANEKISQILSGFKHRLKIQQLSEVLSCTMMLLSPVFEALQVPSSALQPPQGSRGAGLPTHCPMATAGGAPLAPWQWERFCYTL